MASARILLTAAIIAVATGSFAAGSPTVDPAKMTPAKAFFVASVKDASSVMDQWKKTDFYALYKNPAVAAFAGEFDKAIQKLQTDDIMKAILGDDGPRAAGAAFIAAVPVEDEMETLLVVQWKGELGKARSAIARVEKAGIDNGGVRRTSEFRGTEIVTFYESADDATDDDPMVSYCFIDDVMIAGDMEQVKFAAAHLAGASGSTLSEDADYQAAMKRVGPGDITLYLGFKNVLGMIMEDEDAKLMVGTLGIDKVPAMAASISIAREPGIGMGARGFVKVDGEKKGLLKIMDLRSEPLSVPNFMPANSHMFGFTSFDLAGAFDEVFKMVNSVEPMAAAMMISPLVPASPEGPAIELKRDVFAHLRPGIFMCESVAPEQTQPMPQMHALVAIATGDGNALQKSIARLHAAMIGTDPQLRQDFMGQTIYCLPVADETPMIGCTVTDTHVILGQLPIVMTALRSMRDTNAVNLNTTGWFRKGAARLPASAGYMAIADYSAVVGAVWKALKMNMGGTELPLEVGAPDDWFEGDKMPEFDLVKKHFGLAAFYFNSVDDGFLVEYKMLSAGE